MAGYAICDDEATKEASKEEIIRRYFAALCDLRMGRGKQEAVDKIISLMNQAGISPEDRKVISAADKKSEATDGQPAVAIELPRRHDSHRQDLKSARCLIGGSAQRR